jgi:5-methylcytosine-specific restriction protein A
MPTINKPKKRENNNKGNHYDKERRKIYNSERWRNIRRLKFAENPLCEICEKSGLTVPAEHVHHITSFMSSDNPDIRRRLAYDWNNIQSLCESCHGKIHAKQKVI